MLFVLNIIKLICSRTKPLEALICQNQSTKERRGGVGAGGEGGGVGRRRGKDGQDKGKGKGPQTNQEKKKDTRSLGGLRYRS